MKTTEKTFYSLCEEIDYLKEEVEYYKNLYKTERADNCKMLSDLLFPFTDDEKGTEKT